MDGPNSSLIKIFSIMGFVFFFLFLLLNPSHCNGFELGGGGDGGGNTHQPSNQKTHRHTLGQ
jgi:hypothetical protein